MQISRANVHIINEPPGKIRIALFFLPKNVTDHLDRPPRSSVRAPHLSGRILATALSPTNEFIFLIIK